MLLSMYRDMLSDYPDVLTPKDVQNILKIGKNATYKLLADGTLKSVIIAGKYRIPKYFLIEYLETEVN